MIFVLYVSVIVILSYLNDFLWLCLCIDSYRWFHLQRAGLIRARTVCGVTIFVNKVIELACQLQLNSLMNTKSGLKHIETITEADEEEEESQIRDILKERINSHFGSGLEKWQKAMEETARNDEQESMSTRYLL